MDRGSNSRGRDQGRGRVRGGAKGGPNSRPFRGRGRGVSTSQTAPASSDHAISSRKGLTSTRGSTGRGAYSANRNRNLDFANLPTISRSGDAAGAGHELKDFKTQEQYWNVIEDRITQHLMKYDPNKKGLGLTLMDETSIRQAKESEDILLIHLRRVREGVSSTQRLDDFALKIYDASLSFAIFCGSAAQIAASMSHFPSAHCAFATKQQKVIGKKYHHRSQAIAILTLAFHLMNSFPSQKSYYHHLAVIPEECLPHGSAGYKWISSIRQALNTRNYIQCDNLTRNEEIIRLCKELRLETEADVTSDILCRALSSVVDTLRTKVCGAAWSVLRMSYREFRFGEDTDTETWLSSVLLLHNQTSKEWLGKKLTEGQVVKAEGNNDRWVVRKQ